MNERTASLLLAALLCAAGASCGGPPPPPSAGPPRRLVSLNPSHTETLLALGLAGNLVGISNFCPAVEGAERLGDLYSPALESILRLRPDRVFTVLPSDHSTVRRLRDVGVSVVSLDPQSLEGVIDAVRAIGEEAGAVDAGKALSARLRERLLASRARALSRGEGPRVYVEIESSPPWTVGPGSFIHEALGVLGARNVFADLKRPYAQISPEEILRRDPEVVVSLAAKARDFRERPGWDRVAAVRAGAIYDDFGPELIAHGSPRLFDGIERLEERLYPVPQSR